MSQIAIEKEYLRKKYDSGESDLRKKQQHRNAKSFFLVQSRVLTVFSQSDIGNPYSFIQFCHAIAITVYSIINVKLHNYVRNLSTHSSLTR